MYEYTKQPNVYKYTQIVCANDGYIPVEFVTLCVDFIMNLFPK